MPRFPLGGRKPASAAFFTSSTVSISGRKMPLAPASKARGISASLVAYVTLTNDTRPTHSAPRMRCSIARGLLPECSLSNITQSNPVSPIISIRIGSPVKHCIPNGIWLCSSICRIRFYFNIVYASFLLYRVEVWC
jgi:hypothetical protein